LNELNKEPTPDRPLDAAAAAPPKSPFAAAAPAWEMEFPILAAERATLVPTLAALLTTLPAFLKAPPIFPKNPI